MSEVVRGAKLVVEAERAAKRANRWRTTKRALLGTAISVLLSDGVGLLTSARPTTDFGVLVAKVLMVLTGPSLIGLAIQLALLAASISDRTQSLGAVDGWLPLSGCWLRETAAVMLWLLGALLFLVGVYLGLAAALIAFSPGWD